MLLRLEQESHSFSQGLAERLVETCNVMERMETMGKELSDKTDVIERKQDQVLKRYDEVVVFGRQLDATSERIQELEEKIIMIQKREEELLKRNGEMIGLQVNLATKVDMILEQMQKTQLSGKTKSRFTSRIVFWFHELINRVEAYSSRWFIALRIFLMHRKGNVFDGEWYLSAYPDVRAAGKAPLFHFARHGIYEGRLPNKLFDKDYYISHNPDIADFGKSSVIHFMLHGFREKRTWGRLQEEKIVPKAVPFEFALWIDLNEKQLIPRAKMDMEYGPLISILLPVFKVKREFLDKAIRSVIEQSYRKWELCVVFTDEGNKENEDLLENYASRDKRIRIEKKPNKGIANNSNAALAMAIGEYIALLDHDDELATGALYHMVCAIQETPGSDFLYSDKDSIDEESLTRQNALFKPGWSPEIMYSGNYLTHFNVIRRSIVDKVGGFRPATDGAQDWDLFLRCCEQSEKIVRVPGILYHWRIHSGSTSTGLASKPYALDAQLATIRDSLVRRGIPAFVERNEDSGFHLQWPQADLSAVRLLVDGSEVLPSKISTLIRGILGNKQEKYNHGFRIITLVDQQDFAVVAEMFNPEPSVEVYGLQPGAKTAEINRILKAENLACRAFLFCSAKVNLKAFAWMKEMTGWVTLHPGIGFASGILLDEQDRVAEAGLITDEFSNGFPLFRGSPIRQWGWFGGPLWYRNVTACNPWIAAVNALMLKEAGYFDESLDWPDTFVQMCRKLHHLGYRGLLNPHVRGRISPSELSPVPQFNPAVVDDPYSHPAFTSVVPFRLVEEQKEMSDSTAVSGGPASYSIEAGVHAKYCHCSLADLEEPQQHPDRVGQGGGAGWCNWFIPPFDNPAYGGIMTILRFADLMKRKRNYRHRFIVAGISETKILVKKVTGAFPLLSDSIFLNLPDEHQIIMLPPSDYSVATLWTTAYSLQKVRNTGIKFYFIQDFEPLFYPAGSIYAQAELTYRFGFYGITNTLPLRQLYEENYQGTAIHFIPQIDTDIFYGDPGRKPENPLRIFFYARPEHPRNGFEIAAETMILLKSKLGNRVRILCAGANFDERQFGLEGVAENLGVLTYQSTAALYRTCDIGLVLMMTRHPSYLPFELMACGTLLISNINPVSSWLLKDEENCLLVPASPQAIADMMERAVLSFHELDHIRRYGHKMIHEKFNNWDESFEPVLEFIDGLSVPAKEKKDEFVR